MDNSEKYIIAFAESLDVDQKVLNDELAYEGISEWDSIGHMGIIAALEEAFDIMMETDDILNLSTFAKGKEILSSNYEIEF